MAWNVRLSEWLLSQSGETLLLWSVAIMTIVLVAMIGWMRMLNARALNAVAREWAEQTGAQVLLCLHQHQVKKIAFRLGVRARIAHVTIEGPHISFGWSPGGGIVSGQDHSITWLFLGHADVVSMRAFMQYMRELASVNDAWLVYREQPGVVEFLRSAEIIPLRKAA